MQRPATLCNAPAAPVSASSREELDKLRELMDDVRRNADSSRAFRGIVRDAFMKKAWE